MKIPENFALPPPPMKKMSDPYFKFKSWLLARKKNNKKTPGLSLISRVADQGGFYPDLDPTFEKKTRINSSQKGFAPEMGLRKRIVGAKNVRGKLFVVFVNDSRF